MVIQYDDYKNRVIYGKNKHEKEIRPFLKENYELLDINDRLELEIWIKMNDLKSQQQLRQIIAIILVMMVIGAFLEASASGESRLYPPLRTSMS